MQLPSFKTTYLTSVICFGVFFTASFSANQAMAQTAYTPGVIPQPLGATWTSPPAKAATMDRPTPNLSGKVTLFYLYLNLSDAPNGIGSCEIRSQGDCNKVADDKCAGHGGANASNTKADTCGEIGRKDPSFNDPNKGDNKYGALCEWACNAS